MELKTIRDLVTLTKREIEAEKYLTFNRTVFLEVHGFFCFLFVCSLFVHKFAKRREKCILRHKIKEIQPSY